jgi:hypothetical protein
MEDACDADIYEALRKALCSAAFESRGLGRAVAALRSLLRLEGRLSGICWIRAPIISRKNTVFQYKYIQRSNGQPGKVEV